MKNDLELLLQCPVCNKKYAQESTRVIGGRKGALLVHIKCHSCKSSSLAIISRQGGAGSMISVGMLTDLDYDEAREKLSQEPITVDEVLDVHQNLAKSLA